MSTRATLIEFLACDLCRRDNQPGVIYERKDKKGKAKRYAGFCHSCIFTLARMYRRAAAQKAYQDTVKDGQAEWAKSG
jgi:hypothetical protein